MVGGGNSLEGGSSIDLVKDQSAEGRKAPIESEWHLIASKKGEFGEKIDLVRSESTGRNPSSYPCQRLFRKDD